MIKKIISGGQTGVDVAALMAAKCLGIETGGYMARHWRDEWGHRPHYERVFNMKEIDETRLDRDYQARTRRNVYSSDATVVFYGKESPGTSLTVKTCEKQQKPLFQVPLGVLMTNQEPNLKENFQKKWCNWVQTTKPEVLNVAGNRESVCLGITFVVFNVMLELLTLPNVSTASKNEC